MNRTERLSAQHDWSAVLLIVHEQRTNNPILCARSPARSRSVRRFARAIPIVKLMIKYAIYLNSIEKLPL